MKHFVKHCSCLLVDFGMCWQNAPPNKTFVDFFGKNANEGNPNSFQKTQEASGVTSFGGVKWSESAKVPPPKGRFVRPIFFGIRIFLSKKTPFFRVFDETMNPAKYKPKQWYSPWVSLFSPLNFKVQTAIGNLYGKKNGRLVGLKNSKLHPKSSPWHGPGSSRP